MPLFLFAYTHRITCTQHGANNLADSLEYSPLILFYLGGVVLYIECLELHNIC